VLGSELKSVNLQSATIQGWLPVEIGGGGGGVAPAEVARTPTTVTRASAATRRGTLLDGVIMLSLSGTKSECPGACRRRVGVYRFGTSVPRSKRLVKGPTRDQCQPPANAQRGGGLFHRLPRSRCRSRQRCRDASDRRRSSVRSATMPVVDLRVRRSRPSQAL